MSSADIARPVGDIPSGLFIVCAKDSDRGRIDGFLGSWIQQVSFEPLLISLCVKEGRPASDMILDGRIFSINVVGDHDKSYLKHFWSGYKDEVNPFDELPHQVNERGAVILEGSKSAIICEMVERHSPGDHHLVVAKVIDGVVNEEKSKSAVHLRKSGLDY